MGYVNDVDTQLLKLSDGDVGTPRQDCGELRFFAGIGEGKSSSAHVVAGACLRAGFGGLVTAVKPEEAELWKRYAEEHGRKDSLILFDETDGSSTHVIDKEPEHGKEKGQDVDLDL